MHTRSCDAMHRKAMFLTVAATILLGGIPSEGPAAEEHLPRIETVLVTGTRLADGPEIATTVLDRSQIELLSPGSTTSLLRAIPHLYLFENGGPGGLSFASLRGGDPNFTLVLVDGVAVNDPTNSRGGGFDFNQLDPATIERVEVHRGGISAIYGGEALSGVIHFITREAAGTQIAASVGNQGQRQVNATASGTLSDSVSGLVSLGRTEFEASASQRYRNEQALFKLRGEADKARGDLLLSIGDQAANAFPEDSGGELSTLEAIEYRDGRQLIASARGSLDLGNSLSATALLSHTDHREDSDHPGIAPGVLDGVPPSMIRSRYEQTTLDVNLAGYAGDNLRAVAGTTLRLATGRNDGFVDFGAPVPVDYRLEQNVLSAYAEAGWIRGRVSANAGLRIDDPEGFRRETSLRLSASYAPTPRLSLTAAASEGYKLPSFFALAHPLVGNPELQPESSEAWELGVAFSSSELRIEATYFNTTYENLVDFDPEAFSQVNRGKLRMEGLELGTDWAVTSMIHVAASASYLDAKPTEGEGALRRRPEWLANLQGSAQLNPRLRGFLAIRHRDQVIDSSVLTGPMTLGQFSSVDAGAKWSPKEQVEIGFIAENLLDLEREDAIGLQEPGRTWRLSVTLRI